MNNPLDTFQNWFVSQDEEVKLHVSSFLLMGIPDTGILNKHFIEDDPDNLLIQWLENHKEGQSPNKTLSILGAILSIIGCIDFFFIRTQNDSYRKTALDRVTDKCLSMDELLTKSNWISFREDWQQLRQSTLSDSALDQWPNA